MWLICTCRDQRVVSVSASATRDTRETRLRPRLNTQLRWFVHQLRPLLRAHLLSVFLIVLTSLMFLLDPLLIKWLIDRVLPTKNYRLLLVAALGFLALYLFRLGFFALAQLMSFRTVQDLVFHVRLGI